MKKLFLILVIISLAGCEKKQEPQSVKSQQPIREVDPKYQGKTFTVRAIFWSGDNSSYCKTWKNAKDVSPITPDPLLRTGQEYYLSLSFYVNEKMVEINNALSVVLSEDDIEPDNIRISEPNK